MMQSKVMGVRRIQRRRGSVTVLALMVWMLLMLLVTATMALTIVDDEMVNDFARNKKSFQAADSGIIHGSRTLSAALADWSMPVATDRNDVDTWAGDAMSDDRSDNRDISLLRDVVDNIDNVIPRLETSTTGTTESVTGGIQVGYESNVDITPTEVEFPADGDIQHRHVFHYNYEITSAGEAEIGGIDNTATRVERGEFQVEVQRPSFATYGYFTDSMKNQYDQQLVFFDGEVYEGRTHVNAEPPSGRCGFWGSAEFNGKFTAVQDTYEESWLGGNADPHFNQGAEWNVDRIELPENGWSQMRASIGDYENIDNTDPPTNLELRSLLGLPPLDLPIDQGVYFAPELNLGDELLGGIFINGNANGIRFDVEGTQQIVEVHMNILSGLFAGNNTWQFRSNAVSGTTEVLLNNVPLQTFNDDLNGLIHINGNVLNLSGDGELDGADIESHQEMTVSATGDITIGGHITYETDPAENPDAENILGIFSSNGNIWLGKNAPTDLQVHASVMAASDDHGVGAEDLAQDGGYDAGYPNKGKWNLLGGLIEDKNQTTGVYYTSGKITGYLWDFDYDERFAAGVAPPYFPYVTKFEVNYDGMEPGLWGRKYY